MRRYHVLCSAILLLASSSLFAETTFRLQTLRVTGSHRFREEELVAALGLKPGNQVDLSALKKAADQLMRTGTLATLNYTYTPLASGIVVEYQVIDAAEFLPCRYENVVWMDSAELTKEVHEAVPLFNGELPASGTLVDQVSEAISAILGRHGVATKVRYELHTRGVSGPVDAILFVSDTVKPKVQEIILSGANLLTPEEKLENTKRLIGDEYFATNVHDSLANGLGFLYGNRGYLRLEVGEPQPVLVDNSPSALLRVTVPVDEGAQYRVKSIAWSGAGAALRLRLISFFNFIRARSPIRANST